MEKRHGMWLHPFLIEPRAGEREICVRPGRTVPIVRGREAEHAEK